MSAGIFQKPAWMRGHFFSRAIFTIKFVVTLALCILIFRNVDWHLTWLALRQTSPFVLAVVFIGMILNVTTSAFKWKILLALHGIQYKLLLLFRYYLIGSFFNNFLPSTIGGDGYRLYKTLTNPVSKAGAVAAIFVERITGLLALIVIGYLGAVVSYFHSGNEIAGFVVFWGSWGVVLCFCILFIIQFIPISTKQQIRGVLPRKLSNTLGFLSDYRGNLGTIVAVILLSFFFQIFLLILYCLLLMEVAGRYVSIFDVSVAVSLSTLISLLPLSINGIGLLDGSFIYVLKSFHVGYEQAVIVMILMRLLGYLQSLIGGVLYFFEKRGASRCGDTVL